MSDWRVRKARVIVLDQSCITTEVVVLTGGIGRPLLARRGMVEVLLIPLEHQYTWLGPALELAPNGLASGLLMTGHFMCATMHKARTLWRWRAGSIPQGANQFPVFAPLAARHCSGRRRWLRNELVSPFLY